MTKGSEDIQSSAHVWGEGYADDPNNRPLQPAPSQQNLTPRPSDAPPSYTNATSTSSLPTDNSSSPQIQRQPTPSRPRLNPIQALSTLSNLPFHSYTIPNATLTPNRSTTTSTYAPFYSSVASLTKLITDQSSLPPRPLLRIKGTHNDNAMRSVIDFDIVLNLTSLLDLFTSDSSTPTSDRLTYKELPLEAEPSRTQGSKLFKREKRPANEPSPLQKWVTKFINDKSENKSFILTRVIPHFIALQQSLEGNLRTLLHTLQYRGKVEVSFPIQYSQVIVSKKPSNWFVSILNMYPEKKYDVLESTWQFRGHPSSSSATSSSTGVGAGMDPITRSEQSYKSSEINARSLAEEFWGDWRDAVRNAVLMGRKGRVGLEEWIECQMGRREKERKTEWGGDGSWDTHHQASWGKGDEDL